MAQSLSNRWSTAAKKRKTVTSKRTQKQTSRMPRIVVIIAMISMVVAVVLTVVWKNVRYVDMGYRIARLEKRLEQNRRVNSELLVEHAMLSSSEQIEKFAKEKLGMVPAKVYGPVPLVVQNN